MKEFRLFEYKELIDFTDYEMTAKQAIQAKCLECSGFEASEAKHCNCTTCPLYKFNKKWFRIPKKVNFTEDELKKRSDRMKKLLKR